MEFSWIANSFAGEGFHRVFAVPTAALETPLRPAARRCVLPSSPGPAAVQGCLLTAQEPCRTLVSAGQPPPWFPWLCTRGCVTHLSLEQTVPVVELLWVREADARVRRAEYQRSPCTRYTSLYIQGNRCHPDFKGENSRLIFAAFFHFNLSLKVRIILVITSCHDFYLETDCNVSGTGTRSHEHVPEASNTPKEIFFSAVIKQLWAKPCLLYYPNFPNKILLLNYRAKDAGCFHRWTLASVRITSDSSLVWNVFIYCPALPVAQFGSPTSDKQV